MSRLNSGVRTEKLVAITRYDLGGNSIRWLFMWTVATSMVGINFGGKSLNRTLFCVVFIGRQIGSDGALHRTVARYRDSIGFDWWPNSFAFQWLVIDVDLVALFRLILCSFRSLVEKLLAQRRCQMVWPISCLLLMLIFNASFEKKNFNKNTRNSYFLSRFVLLVSQNSVVCYSIIVVFLEF